MQDFAFGKNVQLNLQREVQDFDIDFDIARNLQLNLQREVQDFDIARNVQISL